MLTLTEQVHANFERLARTIFPMVKELESFHQELYKLYHYYIPEYDLEKIRQVTTAMQEKLIPLKEAKLHSRLTDRQDNFDSSVVALEASVNNLANVVNEGNKEAITQAVEEVHDAYRVSEVIFD